MVVVAVAMMVVPRPGTATPHHRTTNETATATEREAEAEYTTRTRMQTERPIRMPATLARTRTRILSRTPKRVESAHRGVLRLVQSAGGVWDVGMREGRGIMPLALDKTRGCIRMREKSQTRRVESVNLSEHSRRKFAIENTVVVVVM